MLTTTLRNAGGSVVMSIPKRVLELVNLRSGSVVDIDVKDGQLVIGAVKKPSYALAELLAQCDSTKPISEEDRDWLDAPIQGLESI